MLAAKTFIFTDETPPEVKGGNITEGHATQIANNLLKVNIFFESKMTKLIQETKTYDSVG